MKRLTLLALILGLGSLALLQADSLNIASIARDSVPSGRSLDREPIKPIPPAPKLDARKVTYTV